MLYLHVGDPGTAVDFDSTPEGHHTRYGPDGSLVGLTILGPRWLLEHDGKIVITLPEQRVEATGIKQGRHHRSRCRLAVRAADRDATLEPHQLGEHFGTAHHRKASGRCRAGGGA